MARECYQAVLAAKENHTWMIEKKEEEKVEALETTELVEREPMKTTKVGTTISVDTKKKLVQLLKENMPSISLEIIQHNLDVDPKKKPVQ